MDDIFSFAELASLWSTYPSASPSASDQITTPESTANWKRPLSLEVVSKNASKKVVHRVKTVFTKISLLEAV